MVLTCITSLCLRICHPFCLQKGKSFPRQILYLDWATLCFWIINPNCISNISSTLFSVIESLFTSNSWVASYLFGSVMHIGQSGHSRLLLFVLLLWTQFIFNPGNNRHKRPTYKKQNKPQQQQQQKPQKKMIHPVQLLSCPDIEGDRMSEDIDEGQKLLVSGISLGLIK